MTQRTSKLLLGTVCCLVFAGSVLAQTPNYSGCNGSNNCGTILNTEETATPQGFEAFGSFLLLQPGIGNLKYATLVSPFPLLSPNWEDQAVSPDFHPSFNFGFGYVFSSGFDVSADWTHLNTFDEASATASGSQLLGPSYLFGPPPSFTTANAVAHFSYDAINANVGFRYILGNHLRLHPIMGVQIARISQRLTTNFRDQGTSTAFSDDTRSLFTGAGPRLGLDISCNAGNFELIGGISSFLLIGRMENNIYFNSTSSTIVALGQASNLQSLSSPNSTQVIPGIDTKLGGGYSIAVGEWGFLKFQAGYQAAVYVNAVNQYTLTEVENPASIPFEGSSAVFLRTAVGTQSNFFVHGPYARVSFEY